MSRFSLRNVQNPCRQRLDRARGLAAVALLAATMTLGGCSSFAGMVADHWPHWAGGMPDDVPPRPGAPGYDAFVAHGRPPPPPEPPSLSAAPPPAAAEAPTGGSAGPQPRPPAAGQPAAAQDNPDAITGLY